MKTAKIEAVLKGGQKIEMSIDDLKKILETKPDPNSCYRCEVTIHHEVLIQENFFDPIRETLRQMRSLKGTAKLYDNRHEELIFEGDLRTVEMALLQVCS